MRIAKRNRFVATLTGTTTFGALLTSDNQVDIWFVHDLPVSLLGFVAAFACVGIAIRPESRRWLPTSSLSVLYWSLRAVDVLLDVARAERNAAAAFNFLCLAGLAYSYWSLAVRYEALAGALRRDIERDANRGDL